MSNNLPTRASKDAKEKGSCFRAFESYRLIEVSDPIIFGSCVKGIFSTDVSRNTVPHLTNDWNQCQ